jgi:outer membrane protein TolC
MEQNIALQENALRILTGALPDKVNRSSDWKSQAFADALPAGIPASLLSRRPDIKTQELALAIADANTAISKSMLYPSLRITAGGGVNAFKASNWFNIPASLFGTVAGGLAQPLLQHKELKTRYLVAKTEREQAVIRFRQSVLLAVGEVADALVRIDKLKAQYDITASRVATLHQATGNAHLLFRNGMADYLEVITAESNVLRGELELAAIKRSELAAVTDLYKALGGGWR